VADVNANINIDIDSSDAIASLKSLQSRITEFNNAVIRSNTSAVAAQKSLLNTLNAQIGAAGQFSTSMVGVESSVNRLGTAIDKNKLSLGEYFKYGVASTKTFGRIFSQEHNAVMDLAADRVKRLQTQYIALEKGQNGLTRAMAVRPLHLFNADAAVSIQRQQLFNKLLHDGSTSLINFGKNTQWAGRQLMVGFSVPLVAFGAAASKTFMDLDKQARDFKRVYGDAFTPPEEIQKNLDAVQNLGKEYTKYGISLKDTMTVASTAAAAGMQNEKLTANTEQALRLATVGQIDYQQALTTTITLQNAFKISNEQLAPTVDFIGAVANQTVLSVDDLTNAIPRVAPVIQGLGGDVKDLAVMLVAMKEGGVSAEQGANALKSGLASLINPTKSASEAAAKYGINIKGIVQANKGDLMGTVQSFGAALSKLDQFSRQQVLEKVFGKYQFARIGALFDNINEKTGQVKQSMDLLGMSTQDLAAISDKSLSQIAESTTAKFQSAVEKLKIAIAPIGEIFLKVLTPILDFATKLLDKFNDLSPGVKQFITILTIGLGVVVPAAIMLVGLFANFAGNAVKGLSLINTFFNRIKSGGSVFKYMSGEELDAAAAASSLEGKTNKLTSALNVQREAVMSLSGAYGSYVRAANSAAGSLPQGFRSPRRMATGGFVAGSGNQDSEPALLMPGEFVVNKPAAQKYGPILGAMNSGTIKGYSDGTTQRTHITGARSLTVSEALEGPTTQSLKTVLSIIEKVESALGRSVSSIAAVSNLIVEMPKEFNSLMKSQKINDGKITGGMSGKQFAQQFSSIGIEKWKTTVGITKQNFDDLAPHLAILDRNIANISKDMESVGDLNIDEITRKAFEALPAQSRKMLSEIEALSNQYHNLRITVNQLDALTNEEKQKLAAAGVTFARGSDADRQYITVPGLGTASVRSRQETRSVGPTYRRARLTGLGLGQTLDSSAREAVGAASPAKKGEQLTEDYAEGMLVGSQTGKRVSGKAGSQLGKSFNLNLDNELAKKYGSRFPAGGGMGGGNGPSSPITNPTPSDGENINREGRKLSSVMRGMSGKLLAASAGASALTLGLSFMNNSVGDFIQKIMPMAFAAEGILAIAPQIISLVASTGPFGIAIAAIAAVGASLWAVNKVAQNVVDKGKDLADAMYGTQKSVEDMAAQFGNKTYSQQLAQLMTEKTSGSKISQENQSQASAFIQSEAGQKLLSDINLVKQNSGNADAAKAFSNQLERAIASGAIGPEIAYAIVSQVSAQLNDTKLASDVSAHIKSIVNIDGTESADGRLKLYADIFANSDGIKDAMKSAGLAWDGQSWFAQVATIVTGRGTADIAATNLGESLVQSQKTMQELLAKNKLDFEQNNITAEQFLQYQKDIVEAAVKQGQTWDQVKTKFKEAYPDKKGGTDLIAQPVIDDFLNSLKSSVSDSMSKGIIDSLQNIDLSKNLLQKDSFLGIAGIDNGKINALNPEKIRQATEGAQLALKTLEDTRSKQKGILSSSDQLKLNDLQVLLKNLQNLEKSTMNISVAVDSGVLDPQAFANLVEGKDLPKLMQNISLLPDSSSLAFFQLITETGGKGHTVDVALNFVNSKNFAGLDDLLLATTNLSKTSINPDDIINPKTITSINKVSNELNKYKKDIDGLNKQKIKTKTINFLVNDFGIAKDNVDWFLKLDPIQQRTFLTVFKSVQEFSQTAQQLTPGSAAAGGIGGTNYAKTFTYQPPTTSVKNKNTPPVTDGSGSKTKSWLQQQIDDTNATAQMFPKLINQLKNKFPNLPKAIIDAIGTGEEGLKNLQSLLKADPKKIAAFFKTYTQNTIGESARAIQDEIDTNKEKITMVSALKSAGYSDTQIQTALATDAFTKEFKAMGITATNAGILKNKLTELSDAQKAAAEAVMTPEQRLQSYTETINNAIAKKEMEIRNDNAAQFLTTNGMTTEAMQHQIYENNKLIQQEQDKINAKQSQIDALNRENELNNRISDALSHDLEIMSQQEQTIRDTYQQRIDSLNKVVEINNEIMQQQQSQIDLSKSLSEGDVYAAAKAAEQMQQQQVQFAQKQQQDALQAGMQNAIDNLRTPSGLTRKQAEQQINTIKEQSYQTGLRIRNIEDEIYTIQNGQMKTLQSQNDIYSRKLDYNQQDLDWQIATTDFYGHSISYWKNYLDNVAIASKNTNDVADAIRKLNAEFGNLLKNNAAASGAGTPSVGGTPSQLPQAASNGQPFSGMTGSDINNLTGSDIGNYLRWEYGIGTGSFTMATGGMVPRRYAFGGHVGMDSVPAMLTPGEFVMRKAAVQRYGAGTLSDMNTGRWNMPTYNTNKLYSPSTKIPSSARGNMQNNISAPVYNTYSINVPVNQPGASADEIANKVMMKIKNIESSSIRRIGGY
jgi:TP901 family phage tail tape measure protein